MTRLCALALCLLSFVLPAGADVADDVVAQVLANVAKVRAADPQAVPMAFWDFDGTIVKGDVSEGLEENGKVLFKGLVQRTIEEGLSPVYAKGSGLALYQKDYLRMQEIGRWLAWPYNAQIYPGVPVAKLDEFCRREFDAVYRRWYFRFSVKVLKALEAAGVENYIGSGSPELFVRNAAESLGIPRSRFRGIRVVENGGRMTTQIVYPISFGEGKVETVRELILACPHAVAVAGFGNSYTTDGYFLRYIATQPSLPGGAKGTAVMINGGETKKGFSEHFILLDETEVVGRQGSL